MVAAQQRAALHKMAGGCKMTMFRPEGTLLYTEENQSCISSTEALRQAMSSGRILEGRAVLCDSEHNLVVDLGGLRGLIPRAEGALGIREGTARDIAIISRTGKPVCFQVTDMPRDAAGELHPLLSRRAVQQRCCGQYIAQLRPGQVIPARVTHLEPFGCFADIGCGIVSLIPIDAISVSRISHPADRFHPGQDIFAVVRGTDEQGRVTLGHKELLGTWEENAARFRSGETVAGIIRSAEPYGVFIELAPNLAGLAEPCPGAQPGQHASVYIKSLIPEKMKVKLMIVDIFDPPDSRPAPLEYFVRQGVLKRWKYSPDCAGRSIETVFDPN